ncbi:FAD binding domain-containing protein [Rhodobacter sp. KR11]|uniref:FAD binding domain-containing protein n=1 Tax=Rhodobacter sp. KR11 TaxID=2974588 RepID=UPI002222D725|nr:FAD binding domain-containing protein [Rhodobacter sp. KR11]MCW1920292.1 FAD binding domain-containing protein [Rhodobacter sp. KR11]
MTCLQVTKLQDALQALAGGGVTVIAGGTDWFPAQGDRPIRGGLLDITGLGALSGISRQGTEWRIGATTTWSALAAANLPPGFDGLRAAARQVGSVQVQNAGTIAGNICNASPAADGVPPLLALLARVELASVRGTRHLALADFLLGPRRTARAPDELVTALILPDPGAAVSGFAKLGARRYLVISIAMVAANLTLHQGRITAARIAVGACAPVAMRLPAWEAALEGHPLSQPLPVPDLQTLAPLTDVRATAAYRRAAVATLLTDLVTDLIAKGAS